MKWIIEGEWSGHRPSQRRILHREVTDRAEFVQSILAVKDIRYPDGTRLHLSVRPVKAGEKVQEIHGCNTLIRMCVPEWTWMPEETSE